MLNRLSKYIANKKGMSTIEFIISFMVFIMLFSYIFDLCLITYKQYAVAEQTSQIARQVSKQSGCEKVTPFNFPGGNENYYTQLELYRIMERKMNNLNIPATDWNIIVKTKTASGGIKQVTLTNSTANNGIKAQYRDFITVQVTYNYEWGLWSQFVPGTIEGKTIVERSAFCEYNHNLND